MTHVHQLAAAREPFIGFWFRGLFPKGDSTRSDWVLLGFVMQSASHRDSLLETLSKAPIVATFRSAREAHAVAERIAAEAGSPIIWCRAEYAGSWQFLSQDVATTDDVIQSSIRETTIGEDNWAVEECHALIVLPPPLRERGVAVAIQGFGKAFHLPAAYPRDMSTFLYTSWNEMNQRPPGRLDQECSLEEGPPYLGAGFRMYYLDGFNGDRPIERRILWKDRLHLRERQP